MGNNGIKEETVSVALSELLKEKNRLKSVINDFSISYTRLSINKVRVVYGELIDIIKQNNDDCLSENNLACRGTTTVKIKKCFWKRVRGII